MSGGLADDVPSTYEDSDEEVMLSEPSESGDLDELDNQSVDQDTMVTNDRPSEDVHTDAPTQGFQYEEEDPFDARTREEEERSAAHRLAARAFQSATGSPPTGDSAQTADEDKAGDSASAASKPQEDGIDVNGRVDGAAQQADSAPPADDSAADDDDSAEGDSPPADSARAESASSQLPEASVSQQTGADAKTSSTDGEPSRAAELEEAGSDDESEQQQQPKQQGRATEGIPLSEILAKVTEAQQAGAAGAGGSQEKPQERLAEATPKAPVGLGSAMPRLPQRPSRLGPSLPPRPASRSQENGPASKQPAEAAPAASSSASNPEDPRRVRFTAPAKPSEKPSAEAAEADSEADEAPRAANPSPNPNMATAPAAAAAAASGAVVTHNPGHNNPSGGNPHEAARQLRPEQQKLADDLQEQRIFMCRAALRLGASPNAGLVQHFLYRLNLAESIKFGQPPEDPSRKTQAVIRAATEAEGANPSREPYDSFPLATTVLVIGPVGSGKSATINSLLGRQLCETSATSACTRKVRVVEGQYRGMPLKFVDTPGLELSSTAVGYNNKVLNAIKGAQKKHKPDLVLYVDRCDVGRTLQAHAAIMTPISRVLGVEVWFNCIAIMTHGAAVPPEGPSGGPLPYSAYLQQRQQSLALAIRRVVGDARLQPPVVPVENHHSCRANAEGELILPNEQAWRPDTVIKIIMSRLLARADKMLDMPKQNLNDLQFLLGGGGSMKLPPLPYLVSGMATLKAVRKLPEEDREYMRTDKIKRLSHGDKREQMHKRRSAMRLRREEKRMEAEGVAGSSVYIPPPDPLLPPAFDQPLPNMRLRSLSDGATAWRFSPAVGQDTIDHEEGIEAVILERSAVLRRPGQLLDGVPLHINGQVSKDKGTVSLQSELESSVYHTSRIISTLGSQYMTLDQGDAMWVGSAETRLGYLPKTKISAGALAARLVEDGGLPTKGPLARGVKVGSSVRLAEGAKLKGGAARIACKTRMGQDKAQAAQVELHVRTQGDAPFTRRGRRRREAGGGDGLQRVFVLGASLLNFRNDKALVGNASTQLPVTPQTQVALRGNVSNKGAGALTLHLTSHDIPQLGFVLLVPAVSKGISQLRQRFGSSY